MAVKTTLFCFFMLMVAAMVGAATVVGPATALDPPGSGIFVDTESGNLATPGQENEYAWTIDSGQTITVLASPQISSLQLNLELTDTGGSVLASATATSAGERAIVQTVPAGASGTYTLTVSAAAGTGDYVLDFLLNAAIEEEGNGGPINDTAAGAQDISGSGINVAASVSRYGVRGWCEGTDEFYMVDFTGLAGTAISIVAYPLDPGTIQVEILDSSLAVLGTGLPAADRSSRITDFVVPTDDIYFIDVTGDWNTWYTMLVVSEGNLEEEPNDSVLQPQPAVEPSLYLAAIDASVDAYAIATNAGDLLSIRTTTPWDGGGDPANTLDPRLDLYDGSGQLVATDDDGAADGRNAIINHEAASSGDYVAVVSAVTGLGAYTVDIAGATGSSLSFVVVGVWPGDGAAVTALPTSYLVDLSFAADPVGLDASDLTVNGSPAGSVTMIDGRLLSFDLSPAAAGDGTYTISIADSSFLSLYGAYIEAFSATLEVDSTGPNVWSTMPSGVTAFPVDTVVFSFNEELDPGSVDVFDVVSFVGPPGDLWPEVLNVFAAGPDLVVEIVPQFIFGPYEMIIGPDIFDFAGNPMDQDLDGLPGEPFDDTAAAFFELIPSDLFADGFESGNTSAWTLAVP